MRRSFAAMTILLLVSLSARADDWPEFRGPTGQGHVLKGSLPTEWGPKKNIAWKQAIPGLGWSSPVVSKGKVYLTTGVVSGTKKDQTLSLRALAVDAASGRILWDTEVFQPKSISSVHSKNSHASPTPLVDGDRIVVHFGHYGTAALDAKGKILWKNDKLGYAPVHGNGGCPVIVGPALIYSADGGDKQFVVALDRKTGSLLWKTERKTASSRKFAFSTPLAVDVKGKTQVVAPGAGIVAAYDPVKGKELWRVDYGEGYSVVPRPVFGHGMVYLSSGYNTPVLYAIRVDGEGDVTKTHVAWTLTKGAPLTPSPLLVGDELYTVSDRGLASCLDAKTGAIHWQDRVPGAYSASPIFADGKIYFLSEDGIGAVVKASKSFEMIATNEMNEKTLASYAAANGALYLRTEKNLYKIQGR